MMTSCIEWTHYKSSTDIEMLRTDEHNPDESPYSLQLVNIPHPSQLLHMQSSISFSPDVSFAFRSNGRDCFFNSHDMYGTTSDHEVPIQDSAQTIQIVHHYFHHFLPARPKLVAPPLQVVPVLDKKDDGEGQSFFVTSSPACVPDIKTKVVVKTSSPTGQTCAHCSTEATSLWRRVEDRLMCNACALYLKLHGFDRPLHLSTGVIKRRNRVGGSLSRRSRKH